MDLTSDVRRTRRACKRTKSGCLPCRRRRKKCDEIKPECSGCLRNQLICAWPSRDPATPAIQSVASMTERNLSSMPHIQTQIRQSTSDTTDVLAAPLSSLPPAFRGVEAASLLDSFTELTAPRMVGKGDIENPFITYNIRVSMHSTALQHAILAVSSCHRAYSEPAFSLSSRDHYAVALRSLKVGITKWNTCSVQDRIALLASCLTLCWYEVIDADIRGSLYYHLRASGSMISDLRKDERCRDENFLGFFSEQFSYLAIVANIGIGQASSDRLLDPRSLSQPLHTLNQDSPIYGFMFGCSHALFELIPRIARLSSRFRARRDSSSVVQKEYDSIFSAINSWLPNSPSDDPGYELAGEMYRAACLVFLRTSMKGHEYLEVELYNQVEPSIALFLESFKQLSGESPPWTTFMWPTLVVGSCMREESQRETLLQLLGNSNLRMQTVDSTAHWLSLHWEKVDKDVHLYGIDGLEKTMKEQGLDPCVG
ncbi:Zn(2)-C6 fungal-type domain-containing protein [Fusarium keratoplasticum]|nr:Zn(2)-C6 fungal-type domain-containing protein [Fusarium keratoplasticum]